MDDARERRAWYLYDWANSAFYTTVASVVFGVYAGRLARAAADAEGYVHPLGIPVYAESYWGYLLSGSDLLQVLLLPVVGALADTSRRRRELLGLFAYAGAAVTMAMFFLDGPAYLAGGLLFVCAKLAFGSSVVVYNAFLPHIAAPEERDAVSSKGWGIGYLGGGLHLALVLALFFYADRLDLRGALPSRIALCSAGAWWALFTLPAMLWLRNRAAAAAPASAGLGRTFRQLAHTLRGLRRYPQALTFLIAFLLYNDGIQAVINLASPFADQELRIPQKTVALSFLMVQFMAFFGALGFNAVARAIGAKRAILASLAIWTAVVGSVLIWVRTTAEYFLMAAAVAVVLGGSQALSRSLFSQMIPKGREAEYFSLYEVGEKGSSWMAPLLFALTVQHTRSQRGAIVSLIVFFLAGMAVLARVDVKRGMKETEE